MENRGTDIGTILLMIGGAIIGGIAGASTVSDLPDNWEKVRNKLKKPKEGGTPGTGTE